MIACCGIAKSSISIRIIADTPVQIYRHNKAIDNILILYTHISENMEWDRHCSENAWIFIRAQPGTGQCLDIVGGQN